MQSAVLSSGTTCLLHMLALVLDSRALSSRTKAQTYVYIFCKPSLPAGLFKKAVHDKGSLPRRLNPSKLHDLTSNLSVPDSSLSYQAFWARFASARHCCRLRTAMLTKGCLRTCSHARQHSSALARSSVQSSRWKICVSSPGLSFSQAGCFIGHPFSGIVQARGKRQLEGL